MIVFVFLIFIYEKYSIKEIVKIAKTIINYHN